VSPVRVLLTQDAADDLRRVHKSGHAKDFLIKLLRLQDYGENVGLPLRRPLAGWRKIVVARNTWRILFKMDASRTTATVWVIGDRRDSECYAEAERRLAAFGDNPHIVELGSVLRSIAGKP
jgi:mRNA interferase RelE/StbE